MKLNTVLLTSAATLMATSFAFAADLPSKKAAASSGSVQVCKVAGKTGFTLPGSDTCVVVSGYVWAEVNAEGSYSGDLSFLSSEDHNNYNTKLREQLNIDALSNTEMGVLASHASLRFNQYGQSSSSISGAAIDSAYIQLGGFKVGYFDSTFGMMDGSPSVEAPNNSPSTTPMQIGYSAKLGNGMTLGVALEDVNMTGGYDSDWSSYAKMPDVVGTIDFSLANADIHLGAVYHDIQGVAEKTYSASGYAFDAGVTFKLDSLAKGDTLSLEYTYTDGASARLSGHITNIFSNGSMKDVVWNGVKPVGNSYAAAFSHVFSSNLSVNIFGGYQTVSVDTGFDFNSTLVGMNLDYKPVKGFHIQPEVWHETESFNGPYSSSALTGTYTGAVLRIKRDF
jgi:hypothetical protein